MPEEVKNQEGEKDVKITTSKGPLDDLKIKDDLKASFLKQWSKTKQWLQQKFEATKLWLQMREFYQLAIGVLVILAIAGAIAGYDSANPNVLPQFASMIVQGAKNISGFIMIGLCILSKDKSRRLTDLGWVSLALAIPQVAYCAIWLVYTLELVNALASRGFMIGAQTASMISMYWTVMASGLVICFIMLKAAKKQFTAK